MSQFLLLINATLFKQRDSLSKEIAKFDNEIENDRHEISILNCNFGAFSHNATLVSKETLNEVTVTPSNSNQESVFDVHSHHLIKQMPDNIEIVNQTMQVINTRSQSQHDQIQTEKRINNKMNRIHATSIEDFSNGISQPHVRDPVRASPSASTLVEPDDEASSNHSSHGTNDLTEEQCPGNQRIILSEIPSNHSFNIVMPWLNGLIQSSEHSAGLAGSISVNSINIPSPNGERIKIKFSGQKDSIQIDTRTNEIKINISSNHQTVLFLRNHPIMEINCPPPTNK